MDFSTMKKKIDNFGYNNIMEYRVWNLLKESIKFSDELIYNLLLNKFKKKDDFVLMCENAMTYNKSDTIYYHAARKLLDSGLKILNKVSSLSLSLS